MATAKRERKANPSGKKSLHASNISALAKPSGTPIQTLFKDQLNQMLGRMAAERALENNDKALPFWYLQSLLGLSTDDVDAAITEGGNDLGIDAITISDDEATVSFFQFKNPASINKSVAGGDVDKVISGLQLILNRRHKKLANPALKRRIEEVHQGLRRKYRLSFVSTGQGLPSDARIKLDSLCEEWATPSARLLEYECVPLDELQKRYYSKTLPTLDRTIELSPIDSGAALLERASTGAIPIT